MNLPRALQDAYLTAVYEVDFASSARQFRHRESGNPAPALAIVTACNPGLEVCLPEENEARNQWLEERLHEEGLCYVSARGYDPGRDHEEPSFAVLGITLEDACALAREFDQAAIFWWDGRIGQVLFLE